MKDAFKLNSFPWVGMILVLCAASELNLMNFSIVYPEVLLKSNRNP
jgi:hypothetical protein